MLHPFSIIRYPIRLSVLAAFLLAGPSLPAQPPVAFPGALGYGANATGGHGGTVYHVTNLSDSGTGSFRDAVSASGRIIVFDVGGYVQILSPVVVKSNLTIAGQTAPGEGFGVFGCEVSFTGSSNDTTRYMRFRDGSLDPNWAGLSSGSSHTNAVNAGSTSNLIFDHCDFEFAAYNNVDATACVNFTAQYCIFANPIKNQQFNGHFETGPMTFLGNLWANSHNRNPLGKADLQYVNNIVYNYQAGMTTGNSAGVFHWDVINNYFIAGPSTTSSGNNYYQVDNNQQAYATGNLLDGNQDGILNGSPSNTVGSAIVLNTPWSATTTSLPTMTAANAFPVVVSLAGALPHDEVDSLVVSNALSLGTSGKLYSTEASGGLSNGGYGTIPSSTAAPETNSANGMPDYWLQAVGFILSADNHNTAVGAYPASYMPATGYNALDEYLYFCGAPHTVCLKNTSVAPANVSIDLSQYTAGFSASATYSLANITNGAAVLQPNGHTVLFTPTLNFFGRANFDFTVNDGRTLTQTVRVIVTPQTPPINLTWKGGLSANVWDTTTLNWVNSNNAAAINYGDGNNTAFDDTGSNTPAINLTTTFAPALITVDAAQNYTFNGTGNLSGSMALIKSGSGNLTLSNTGANSFTGGVTLNSGTITLSNATPLLGTGTVTLNGGTLNFLNGSGVGYAGGLSLTSNSTLVDSSSSSNLSFGGALTGSVTLNLLLGSVVFSLGGSTTGFNGTLEFGSSSGTLRLTAGAGTAGGNSSLILDLGTNTGVFTNRNGQPVTIGALYGGPNTTLTGASPTPYTIGGANLSTTFSGAIGGANVSVTKVGTGTLTLTGTHTYTGNTTVSGGTLVVSGSYPGTVQATGSGILSPGGSGNPVTLDVGNIALSGGNYAFDLSNSPSGANDQIVVTGNGTISTSGNNTFLINLLNGTLGDGVYTLVTTTGTLGAASGTGLFTNLSSTSRQTYALSRNSSGSAPGFIKLTVSGGPAALTWTGAASGVWDNTTSNWSNSGVGNLFFNLDSVTFGNTGANTSITLSSTVQPTNITFTNSNATSYTLTGSGVISGSGLFLKNGNGTVTLNTANTFSGGSQLNNGTVVLGNATALGTGNVTLNGTILTLPAGATLANTFLVTAPSTITANGNNTIAGTVSGAGNLSLQIAGGNQTFTLQGDDSAYTGDFLAQGAGTLRFNNASNSGLPNATLTLNNSVTADNHSLTDVILTLGALSGDPGTTFTASDQSAANGSLCTLVIGGLNVDSTFNGNISDSANQAISLTKTGTGTLTLAGNDSYSGDTSVQAGTLKVTGAISGDGDMDIATGATLNLVNGNVNIGTLTIENSATLSGNGTIDGDLVLNGLTASTLGGAITVNGDVVNNSVMRLTGGTQLSVTGTFTNNGILDLITSGSGLPANFVNHGTVLLPSSVRQVTSFGVSGTTATLQVQSYVGHNFQLQSTTTLGGTWQNVGPAQAGTGFILTFTDPDYSANPAIFYRILVSP